MGGSLERAQSLPLSWGRGLVGRDGQEGSVTASRSAPLKILLMRIIYLIVACKNLPTDFLIFQTHLFC